MIPLKFYGYGSVHKLKALLSGHSFKRIFLVTGRKAYSSSGAKKTLMPLLSAYKVICFSDFSENPKISDVTKGIALFRKASPDVVLAVGGGSVIDMAKLITILAAQKGLPIKYLKKQKKIIQKGKPLVAIPTTAGAGSEATHFAVAYIARRKYSLAHPYVLPDAAIVDPQFTLSLPPYLTASSGMDALCQAIESYWSINSTVESKRYAKEAISLIVTNLVPVVRSPTRRSRGLMAYAAHLAGKAINITKTTAAHAVAYPFTSYFGLAHGHAVALTIGEFFVYNALAQEDNIQDGRKSAYVKKTMQELITLLGCNSAIEAKTKIADLMHEIGLTIKISELKVKNKKDIELILKNIDKQRLNNNPVKVTRKFLRDMLFRLV